MDAPRVSAATFAVELPGAARSQGVSMVDTIEEARAEGYQRGYAAAAEELLASAEGERQRRLAAVCDALTGAAEALVSRRTGAVSVAEAEMVHLAVELAEAVVRRELALGRQPAVEALQRALSLVPAGEDLLVRLHPGDVIDVAELQAVVPERQVRVVADEAVEPGGCIVDAGPCHVDAQIGPALDRARAVLAGLRPHASRPAPVDPEPLQAVHVERAPEEGEPAPEEGEPVAAEAECLALAVEAECLPVAVEPVPVAVEPVVVEAEPVAAEPVAAEAEVPA